MNPLSRFEVEEICETVYYQVINTMSRYDYVDSSYEFASKAVCDFKEWSYPKFNFRIVESHKGIVNKWEEKLRAEAKSWFEENVVRYREEENRQHEIRKQQREREEREEREAEEREAQLRAARRRQEEEEKGETEEALRRKEREEAEEKQRLAEEEARREAELAIKRKAQYDVNKQKLEQIQAQWKENRDSKSKTQSQPMETKNKMNNTLTCPQCGEEVSPTAKFCTSCGTKLLVVCENCGTSLKSTTKFCTECGTPVNQKTKTCPTPKISKEPNIFHEKNNSTSSSNDSDDNPDSLFNFAIFDLDDNPEKAIKDIEKAAEMNHLQAIKFLSSCYLNGEYVAKDEDKAELFLKRAAELGDAESQYLLACLILQNCDDEPNEDSPEFKNIMKWLTLAAEQNYADAQYLLGTLYAEEDFSLFSVTKAKEWFQKAIENGNEDATEDLKELNEQYLD